MNHITISELPEPLRQLFTQIQHSKTPLTISDRGEPLVIIYPATPHLRRPAFGAMKNSGQILGDLVAPILPASEWEVFR